jgi:hypothetical protein
MGRGSLIKQWCHVINTHLSGYVWSHDRQYYRAAVDQTLGVHRVGSGDEERVYLDFFIVPCDPNDQRCAQVELAPLCRTLTLAQASLLALRAFLTTRPVPPGLALRTSVHPLPSHDTSSVTAVAYGRINITPYL